jgi:hypothetical protein
MPKNRSNSTFEIKPEMKPQDYYSRLINNLEHAIKLEDQLKPETKEAIIKLGEFLYSRSTEFEMLQKQDDAHIFLSVLKSNQPNLLHIFQYYFSGNAMNSNRKESAGKELFVMLDDVNDLLSSNK